MLREESSTKAVPIVLTSIFKHTDENIAVDSAGSMESTIKQKHRSQNSGPQVDP